MIFGTITDIFLSENDSQTLKRQQNENDQQQNGKIDENDVSIIGYNDFLHRHFKSRSIKKSKSTGQSFRQKYQP